MQAKIVAAIDRFETAVIFLKQLKGDEPESQVANSLWIAEGDVMSGLRYLREALKEAGGKPSDLSDPKYKL